LRTPNPSNANNERNVNTSGALNNNNANNAYGAPADCIITARTSSESESSASMQGRVDLIGNADKIAA